MGELISLILIIVGFSIAINIVQWALGAVGRGVKKVVTGKETYYGSPQIKLVDETMEDTDLLVKRIMYRGKIPADRSMNVGISISAFDATEGDEKLALIFALMEQQQEEDNICFSVLRELGAVNVGDTFTDWVELGVVAPSFIQPPKSGQRKIKLVVRLFNSDDPPTVRYGYADGGEKIFAKPLEFDHVFTEKGYEEAAKDREEAQTLSLKIGVAVAMADGNLDDSEGQILKDWIVKEISVFSDKKSDKLKKLFNETLKDAFAEAKSGDLALSPLVERLSEIGEKKTKYDAISLAFDVMAADGVADPEEMSVIRNVAKSLDLDMEEIEKMREDFTLNLSSNLSSGDDLEAFVGIEEGWSDEQKKKHLRSEFQKWSNRLNSLPEGEERESAQTMLDNIASLRKKYG